MTQMERVIAQIRHQESDGIPYTLGFDTGAGYEERLDAHHGSAAWRGLVDNVIRALPAPSVGLSVEPTLLERATKTYWTDA